MHVWLMSCSVGSTILHGLLQDFGEGSVLIAEPRLVGIQHTSNRTGALVCSHCFRFIGSVELQIGLQLTQLQAEGARGRGNASASNAVCTPTFLHTAC